MKISSIIFFTSLLANAAFGQNCSSEQMPSQEMVCVIDYGIIPDSETDSSDLINKAITESSKLKKTLYFPSGKYLLKKNVLLTDNASVSGSEVGATVFYNENNKNLVRFGDNVYENFKRYITVENVIFNNINLELYGRTSDINVRYNAFLNTNNSTPQIFLSSASNTTIKGNILMRGKQYPGLGISTYNNNNALIEGNFLGDLANRKKALGYIDKKTSKLIGKLHDLKDQGILDFDNDQGNYVSAWYATSNLTKSKFTRNFIAGNQLDLLYNAQSGSYDIIRDHIIYIKQYNDVDVVQNYFEGWPRNASGQLKFRNAENLVFAANYLDNVSFEARPYNDVQNLYMYNTYIFNNLCDYNQSSFVSYWQNFTNGENGKEIIVKDFVIFNNLIKDSKIDDQEIQGTYRNQYKEFFAANNKKEDGSDAYIAPEYTKISEQEAIAKLPESKKKYLSYQAILPQ